MATLVATSALDAHSPSGPRHLSPAWHQSDRYPAQVRLSEVLAGLSLALDITEGQRQGHAARTTLIGMRLAQAIGLPPAECSSLFYALLMKDLGCSSNASRFAALFAADDQVLKADLKTIDWANALESFRFVARNVAPGQFWLRRVWQSLAVFARGPEGAREVVRTRCERGADIARLLDFPDDAVEAIRALDEHWDGGGQPYGLAGARIPLLARVLGLAQTVEVYCTSYGVRAAIEMATARRGTWFDPALVDALRSFRGDEAFWRGLNDGHELERLAAVEPADRLILADERRLDTIAVAFAKVIDAKSPWTYQHSTGVARIAVATGTAIGLSSDALRDLYRAALLHDLSKLGVSSLILDKPGRLDDHELQVMRRHPAHTSAILNRVGCLQPLAEMAASHHERLDGKGYHRGTVGSRLDISARVLCAADICDALLATRPYRAGLPPERVLAIMGAEVGTAIDGDCFTALQSCLGGVLGDGSPGDVPAVRIDGGLAEDYQQAA